MIGEDVDLDLLSLFPQMGARIMEGLRERQLTEVTNGEEQWGKRAVRRERGEGPLKRHGKICPLGWNRPRPEVPAWSAVLPLASERKGNH